MYTYTTSGAEQLSLGMHRSFPRVTYMSVMDSGGCSTMDWLPIQQHTEAITNCSRPGGALVTSSTSSTESIAGLHTKAKMTCSSDAYFVPPSPSPGQTWHSTCEGAGDHIDVTGRFLGSTLLHIGAASVDALHTRFVFTFSGAESGTSPTDYWIEPGTGLVLRQVESADIAQPTGPLGSVHYGEQMAITLTSRTPRQ